MRRPILATALGAAGGVLAVVAGVFLVAGLGVALIVAGVIVTPACLLIETDRNERTAP